MNDSAKNNNSPEMMEALGIFGKMLSIASIYGMNHPSVKGPLAETHRTLEAALKDTGQITLGLFNKTLTVNDKMVSEYTIHLRALERKLVSLEIPHLIIKRELSFDELGQLVAALCTANNQAGQTLAEKLDEAGLSNVKTEEVHYVAQHEGEHLVGDKEGSGGNEGEKDGSDGDGKDAPKPAATVHVEQIVAFLKGETASSETPSDDLQQILSNPEKLGQLIMESATVQQSAQSLDSGESLADIVIGCLRKTYEDLSQQKKFKSARGKASLNKSMLLLEKAVVDKIRNTVGGDQPEMDDQILSTLHEMEEERQVDILAVRYAEQHKKLSKSETEIIKYAREHGTGKARELLDAADVPKNEWRRLMARSRRGGGTGGGNGRGEGGGEAIDMEALAVVLDKLENIMQFDEMPATQIKAVIEEARSDIQDVAAQFEQQVEDLEEQIEFHEAGEDATPENQAGRISRADLLRKISLLALELAQPLTVITASIEAALQQISQPDIQKDLLEMAHEGGLTMQELMKRLTTLVGYPSMQEADAGSAE